MMNTRPSPDSRQRAIPRLSSGDAAAAVLAACSDMPLHPERAAAPDGPSMLLNPLCAGSGGTTHSFATITTAQQWHASGNPHRVTGPQEIRTGGSLRLRPGVLVCFDPRTYVYATMGGHLSVDGDDTAQVVLTATDPAQGWIGIMLHGTPSATSFIEHARIEYVDWTAVFATDNHTVVLDSIHIRQSNRPCSSFRRSRASSTRGSIPPPPPTCRP